MMRVDETRHRDKPATIDTTFCTEAGSAGAKSGDRAIFDRDPRIADLSPALVHRHEHIQVLDDKRRTKRDASHRSLLRSHIIVLSIAVRRAETFSEARQTEQKNRHHSNDHD